MNPVGLARIGWKWLLVYCCWLAFELVFIFFFFPETAGRTLEELSFCKFLSHPCYLLSVCKMEAD